MIIVLRCLAWMITAFAVTRLIQLIISQLPRCQHCRKIRPSGQIVIEVHGQSYTFNHATDCQHCTERYHNLWAEVCDHCRDPILVGSLITVPSQTKVHPFVHASCIVPSYECLGKLGENKVLPLWNTKKLEELTIDEMRPLSQGSSGWGLYDSKTALWMGSGEGPLVYGHKVVAQLASQITDIQLGQPEGQTKPKFYEPSPMRERSRHAVKCSGGEAIERLERGA